MKRLSFVLTFASLTIICSYSMLAHSAESDENYVTFCSSNYHAIKDQLNNTTDATHMSFEDILAIEWNINNWQKNISQCIDYYSKNNNQEERNTYYQLVQPLKYFNSNVQALKTKLKDAYSKSHRDTTKLLNLLDCEGVYEDTLRIIDDNSTPKVLNNASPTPDERFVKEVTEEITTSIRILSTCITFFPRLSDKYDSLNVNLSAVLKSGSDIIKALALLKANKAECDDLYEKLDSSFEDYFSRLVANNSLNNTSENYFFSPFNFNELKHDIQSYQENCGGDVREQKKIEQQLAVLNDIVNRNGVLATPPEEVHIAKQEGNAEGPFDQALGYFPDEMNYHAQLLVKLDTLYRGKKIHDVLSTYPFVFVRAYSPIVIVSKKQMYNSRKEPLLTDINDAANPRDSLNQIALIIDKITRFKYYFATYAATEALEKLKEKLNLAEYTYIRYLNSKHGASHDTSIYAVKRAVLEDKASQKNPFSVFNGKVEMLDVGNYYHKIHGAFKDLKKGDPQQFQVSVSTAAELGDLFLKNYTP